MMPTVPMLPSLMIPTVAVDMTATLMPLAWGALGLAAVAAASIIVVATVLDAHRHATDFEPLAGERGSSFEGETNPRRIGQEHHAPRNAAGRSRHRWADTLGRWVLHRAA